MPFILDHHRAQNALRDLRDHLFGHFHDVVVVSISHVELKLSKFRIVFERHAFVAEVPTDLIDAVQSADE